MNAKTNSRPADASSSDYAQDPRYAYLEWLSMEARLLRMELWPEAGVDADFMPCNTFARSFHFPAGKRWQDVEPPSLRAEKILRAVGIALPESAA